MKWSAVLMFFTWLLVTSDGFSLNSDIHRKSNDTVPDTSSNLMKFDENLVKINSNRIINNNEIANKLKRNEEENDEFTKGDSEEDYYYDEDGDDDDDDDDEDDGGEVVDEEGDNDKGNEVRAEEEVYDNNDEDEDESEYVYDQIKDKDIRSEENNGIKYEAELLRVSRGSVFESSKDRTKPIPRYDDTNYNTNNDDNDRDNKSDYSYNKVKYQDSDTADDRSDDDDDSESNTHEEVWPKLEDDNGVRAVVDYVVDNVKSSSSHEEDGKPRCFFGWRLDANGVCAPPRRECEPGLVRNTEGNCVGPDTGYWYK
jgi:hypothetical protein